MNVIAKPETNGKTGSSDPVLRIRNLESYYGPIMAIRGVSLEVREGQIVTVLGANGAGKTTLMKTISGVMDPEKGQIYYNGTDIAGEEPDQVVNRGIVHVPEGREVFPLLSVEENLEMGAYTRKDRGRHPRRQGNGVFLFPDPERAPQTGGRNAVGRSAADAGDRSRTDGAAPR